LNRIADQLPSSAPSAGTSQAGVVGAGLVFVMALGMGWLFTLRTK